MQKCLLSNYKLHHLSYISGVAKLESRSLCSRSIPAIANLQKEAEAGHAHRRGRTCRQVPWNPMNNSLSVRPSVMTHRSENAPTEMGDP